MKPELLAQRLVRDVPDFPKPGILFKDITPVIRSYPALLQVVEGIADWARPQGVDVVLGIEARGFIFGAPVALELGVGFVPLRKSGKLPHATEAEEYSLEYGAARVEIHADALAQGQRVLIVDDLLATGGTASAAVRLVERLGAKVAGLAFLIELEFLHGRRLIGDYPMEALIKYSGE